MKDSDIVYKQLLELCTKAYLKASKLIPYSANKPFIEKSEPHRLLALDLVRKKSPKLKRYRELISSLNLFVGSDKAPTDFLSRQLTGYFDGMENPTMAHLLDTIESTSSQIKLCHKDGTLITEQENIENEVKNAVRLGVGNCGELATLTYVLLLEETNKSIKKENIRLELMDCSTGDHAFVAVNRKLNSKKSDVSSWGPKALIIDSWDGDIMYAQNGQSIFNFKMPRYYDYYQYSISHSPKVLQEGVIGQGLSERFHKQAKKKQRPTLFSFWDAKYTGNKKKDKKKETTVIPMELQDVVTKRKNDVLEEEDTNATPLKKRRIDLFNPVGF